MDVEGAEEEIICSSPNSLNKIQQIVMEVHSELINETKLITTLTENNFKIKKFPSYAKNTYILYGKK